MGSVLISVSDDNNPLDIDIWNFILSETLIMPTSYANNVSKENKHGVMWICEVIADKYYAYSTWCCVNNALNK